MKNIYKILIFAFIFRAILAFIVWHPDLNNHVDWGIRFWQYGPGDFYKQNVWSFSWPNQPPGTMLIFASIRKLFEGMFNFFWWFNVNIPIFPSNIMLFFEERLYQALLKLPAILADLGIAYLIFAFWESRKKGLPAGKAGIVGFFGANLFLWNPVIWYNSSIWGQTDATINFFGIFAVFLLLKKKLVFSFASLLVSLFIKASLLILGPILLLTALKQDHRRSAWVLGIALPLILIGALTIPFSRGEPFSWLFELYKDKVFGWQLHLITANAFNFWAALTGIHEQKDNLFWGPLTFNLWGYVLFGAALLLLLKKLYRKFDERNVIWVAALSFFASFVFLTGMHERYLYPIFPLMTLIVARERKWLSIFLVLSGIHLLNLYNFWWYPRAEWLIEVVSFGDRILPRILGVVVTIIFLYMYFSFLRGKDEKG